MRFILYITASLMALACPAARADACPSPGEVVARKISQDYEWTVDEGITLKDVLSVTHLRAVVVENAGEFVICGYQRGKNKTLNLYAKPKGGLCVVTEASGKWDKSDVGDLTCKEEDPGQCRFQFNCAHGSAKTVKKK